MTVLKSLILKVAIAGILVAPLSGTAKVEGLANKSLGTVDFQTSCQPQAKTTFNQGVALLHHMMYSQARDQFNKTISIDSGCAMAHWGVAMSYFHPLWSPPSKSDLENGEAAIKRARTLKPKTVRESDYVSAVESFYNDWQTTGHQQY